MYGTVLRRGRMVMSHHNMLKLTRNLFLFNQMRAR
jgi:hypothetical protein